MSCLFLVVEIKEFNTNLTYLFDIVQKKCPELVLSNLGDNEKMKESRFVVPQDITDHNWLKRRLDATPNRYGI